MPPPPKETPAVEEENDPDHRIKRVMSTLKSSRHSHRGGRHFERPPATAFSAGALSEAAMDAQLMAAEAVTRVINAASSMLYERYLVAREDAFVSARMRQDIVGLGSWATPVIDSLAATGAWGTEPEPTPPPADAWVRGAVPARAPTEPRRDLAVPRETTPGEAAVAARQAAAAAAKQAAFEAARRARVAGFFPEKGGSRPIGGPSSAPPSPARSATARHCAGTAVCESPASMTRATSPPATASNKSLGAAAAAEISRAAAAEIAATAATARDSARAAAAASRAEAALVAKLANTAFTLDESGGIVLVNSIAPEDFPPLAAAVTSSIEFDGVDFDSAGAFGGAGRAARRRRAAAAAKAAAAGDGKSVEESRREAAKKFDARSKGSNSPSTVGGGGRGGGAGEDGSISTFSRRAGSVRSHGAQDVSARRRAAAADPRFFRESQSLPQTSMLVSEGLTGGSGEFDGDAESSSSPSRGASPPPRLTVSPGVRIAEGGVVFTAPQQGDPRFPSRAAVEAAAKLGGGGARTFSRPLPRRGDGLRVGTPPASPTVPSVMPSAAAATSATTSVAVARDPFGAFHPQMDRPTISPPLTPSSPIEHVLVGGAYAVAQKLKKTGSYSEQARSEIVSSMTAVAPGALGSSSALSSAPLRVVETGTSVERRALFDLALVERERLNRLDQNPYVANAGAVSPTRRL